MKKLIKVALLICALHSANAQVVSQDSRGKDVFEIYKGATLTGSFAPSQLSMQVNYNFLLGNPTFFYLVGDTNKKTVSISHALSTTLKITGAGVNQGKPFTFNNQLVRPAYRLEIGYQRTIDKFDSIELVPGAFTFVAGGNIYGEWQEVNLYDTVKKQTSHKNPFIAGVHGHLTLFHKSGWFAISASQDFGSTYNQDAFIPYQDIAGTYIDQNIVSQGALVGNIGGYEPVGSWRSRLSLPVFVTYWFNFMPYVARHGYFNGPGKTTAGWSFNFFNGSPRKANSKVGQGFGFGMDWKKSKGKWTSPNYFIFGSLDLELLRKTVMPEEKNDTNFLY